MQSSSFIVFFRCSVDIVVQTRSCDCDFWRESKITLTNANNANTPATTMMTIDATDNSPLFVDTFVGLVTPLVVVGVGVGVCDIATYVVIQTVRKTNS